MDGGTEEELWKQAQFRVTLLIRTVLAPLVWELVKESKLMKKQPWQVYGRLVKLTHCSLCRCGLAGTDDTSEVPIKNAW